MNVPDLVGSLACGDNRSAAALNLANWRRFEGTNLAARRSRKSSRKRDKPSVTLEAVARKAGVGASTVSRVLRKQGSFSPRTRDKVVAAVEKLGYVPNNIAGTLASTRSQLVGVVIPSLTNIVFPDLLRGVHKTLDAAGYKSVIGVTEYDPSQEELMIESMLAWRPAGLIIAGLEHTNRARTMLKNSGVRVVEVFDIDGKGIDFVVGFSNLAVGRTSAQFLVSRGYRHFGYVGHNIEMDLRAGKRLSGFKLALQAAGLSLQDQELVARPSSVEEGRNGLARLLARNPAIDAVYFSNDDMAIGGYFHCLANAIAVPDRLALFGCNGLEVARFAPQPLSTIRTPRFLMGETGARLVLTDEPSKVVDLGFELIEGATA